MKDIQNSERNSAPLGPGWIAAALVILLNYLAQVIFSQSVSTTVTGTQKIRAG